MRTLGGKVKRNVWSGMVLLAFTLAAASGARADGIFTASLTGANEVPPVASAATGFIIVTVVGDFLSVDETFSGLTAPASAAHIHCCAALGINTPVALPFLGFPAAVSGSYTMTFNLTTLPLGGEATLLAGLFAGDAYANIHDANFPGGEIRGQLIQSTTSTTPEPGTMLLVGMGLAGLAGWKKRWAA
jgi:hypothetical protein